MRASCSIDESVDKTSSPEAASITEAPTDGQRTLPWHQRFSPALLFAIILLGFGIRFTGLKWGQAYSYFGQGDAVEAYQVAVNYGQGEPRAQYLGQPNYNYHSKLPGTLWTVFCFESCRFWGSVEGIILSIILLNTAVIWFSYRIAGQMLGAGYALPAALLAATLPWVVYYSNGLYNPDVMSFPGALLFLALWRVMRTGQTRAVFWVPVLLLALPQFHMSGLLLIPAVIIILGLSPRPLNWVWLSLGVVAGLCLYLPYLRGDLAHGWQNTRMMFTSQGSGRGYSFESLKAISAPLSFLVSWGPRWTRTAAEYRELGRACFGSFGIMLFFNLISMALAGFMIVGAVLEIRAGMAGFWRAPRQVISRNPGISLLSLLLVLPLLVATVGGQPFHTRYCVVLLPALIPLCALGIVRWLKEPGRRATIARTMFIVTCCANIWLMPAMYLHQGKRIEASTVFVPSFRQLELVYQSLKAHAGTNSTVQVDDSAFLKSLGPGEKQFRDAGLLRPYVRIREMESNQGRAQPTVKIFELRAANPVSPVSDAVAYRGHGIELSDPNLN